MCWSLKATTILKMTAFEIEIWTFLWVHL